MEIVKLKIQNAINKRQLSMQMLGLVCGGTVGLILLPLSLKTGIFIVLGIYYICVLLNNYLTLNKEVDFLINQLEGK